MRRIILHIAIILVSSLSLLGQVLSPMGNGLPAAPVKIASFNDGIVVAYITQKHAIELQVWNGDFWYSIQQPELPTTSNNPLGEFGIVDLITHDNGVYLSAAYESSNSDDAVNYVLHWNGGEWIDISNAIIQKSSSLEAFIIDNDKLRCIGKFHDQLGSYNIVELDGSSWSPKGNLITKNLSRDNFRSVVSSEGKVYATGNFTSPDPGQFSLAVWDGEQWSPAQYPPFLGENLSVGNYNNEVVAYGKSPFSSSSIKISSGEHWKDLSNGLDNISITTVSNFAELDGTLYAVGEFENNSTEELFNIMSYDGSAWSSTNLELSNIQQLFSNNKTVLVSGDFSDNNRLRGIGKIIKDQAQIVARVYHDINGDCVKDADEPWFGNYPMKLNTDDQEFETDEIGQLYLPILKDEYTINAATSSYYHPTCPDFAIDASEFRTYYGAIVGVKQDAGIIDASVSLSDNQSYSASNSDIKTVQVCTGNLGGEQIDNATLTLTLGKGISNFTSELPYTSFVNNKGTWDISVLGNEEKCFNISYTITTVEEASIDANLELQDGQSDEDGTNNFQSLKYKKGSTLVNEKYCANGDIIDKSAETLQYKIGFQNIGDKPALEVKIVDALDVDISLNSQGGISTTTSHVHLVPYTNVDVIMLPSGQRQRKVTTTFKNIELPPSSIDDVNSKGFVEYDISLNSDKMKKGAELCNTARIYFSYTPGIFSEAIITSEVCSQIGEINSTFSHNKLPNFIDGITIGPNPVDDVIHISNKLSSAYDLKIVNTLGQDVLATSLSKLSDMTIDITSYQSGVYFLYADGIFVNKFVVH